jgi:hypothetical protein
MGNCFSSKPKPNVWDNPDTAFHVEPKSEPENATGPDKHPEIESLVDPKVNDFKKNFYLA